MKNYVIGIDIGKTKVVAGLVTSEGKIIDEVRDKTNILLGGQSIIDQCIKMTEALIANNDNIQPQSIGIGASGVIDHKKGLIISSGSIPKWKNIPICDIFKNKFNIPAIVDNDIHAAALGEYNFGASKNVNTSAYVAIGTGIGCTLIRNGLIWRGAHALSGQIAYLPLLKASSTASLSDIITGKGISKRYEIDGGFMSTSDIFDLAKKGDRKAEKIIDEAIEGMALTFAWLQQIIDPELFVIGGGVVIGQTDLLDQIIAKMNYFIKKYIDRIPGGVKIVGSLLGENAGVLGAVVLEDRI